MTSYFCLLMRLSLLIMCVIIIIPVMLVTWQLGARKATRAVMQTGFKFVAWVWNMRIRVDGSPTQKRPLILVSNHFSYLDLLALGSVVPAAFVAKKEIASWPILGLMCKAAGCLFIDRKASKVFESKSWLIRL